MLKFSYDMTRFTKNIPIFFIFEQNKQFKRIFQSIFHALHEFKNKIWKKTFLAITDH
jgi:hypothetical protein